MCVSSSGKSRARVVAIISDRGWRLRGMGGIFVTLGERFQRDTAQDLSKRYGKVVRIKPDGSVPSDNPFVGRSGARPEIWSYGHRNPQSAAVHPGSGKLWTVEHGARGGDEINIPQAGKMPRLAGDYLRHRATRARVSAKARDEGRDGATDLLLGSIHRALRYSITRVTGSRHGERVCWCARGGARVAVGARRREHENHAEKLLADLGERVRARGAGSRASVLTDRPRQVLRVTLEVAHVRA